MNDQKKFVERIASSIRRDESHSYWFNHELAIANIHPDGQSAYFSERKYELISTLNKRNTIGHSWIDNKFPDPFMVHNESGLLWIESIIEEWIAGEALQFITENGLLFQYKNDPNKIFDEIYNLLWEKELKYKEGIQVFIQEYFHIQQINNYLNTLKPNDSKEFSDREKFSDELKEVTHGDNKRKGLSHPEIALICHYIGLPIYSKTAPTLLEQFNKDLKSSKKLDNAADRFVRKSDRINITGNKSADSKRIGTQERVIKYLKENGYNFTEAESDLKELEKNYNQTHN